MEINGYAVYDVNYIYAFFTQEADAIKYIDGHTDKDELFIEPGSVTLPVN